MLEFCLNSRLIFSYIDQIFKILNFSCKMGTNHHNSRQNQNRKSNLILISRFRFENCSPYATKAFILLWAQTLISKLKIFSISEAKKFSKLPRQTIYQVLGKVKINSKIISFQSKKVFSYFYFCCEKTKIWLITWILNVIKRFCAKNIFKMFFQKTNFKSKKLIKNWPFFINFFDEKGRFFLNFSPFFISRDMKIPPFELWEFW